MNKRTIFAGAGVTSVLALAVVTFSSFTQQPASAMQLAQDSSKALQSMGLSDKDIAGLSEQEITYKKYSPQFASWLETAQKAPDLRLLSYDEVRKAYPQATQADSEESLGVIDNPQDGQIPDPTKLKYLEFTLVEGKAKSKIVVGINEHNIPEAALMQILIPGEARG